MKIAEMSKKQHHFEEFKRICLALNLPKYEKEVRFHPVRRWKFDRAWRNLKIAVEYEGINSKKSRHLTLSGFTKDCEKYSTAAVLGWIVIRYTMKTPESTLYDLLQTAFLSRKIEESLRQRTQNHPKRITNRI